jgi:hypothetical protein
MPFSLGSIQHLTAIVTSALDEVTVEELSVPLQDESFAEYWNRTTALAGPLSKILAELPPPVLDRIWGRLEELVAPYSSGEGIAIPGLMLLAAGRRSYTAAAVRRPT